MRYGTEEDIVTFKCETCGKRARAEEMYGRFPAEFHLEEIVTTCSLACWHAAKEEWDRTVTAFFPPMH